MTTVYLPELEAFLAAIRARRSTLPLGPHFKDPWEREVLADALYRARKRVLTRPAGSHRWSRGYHVRVMAASLLRADGLLDLAARMWACPVWRDRGLTGPEARELSTDGPLQG